MSSGAEVDRPGSLNGQSVPPEEDHIVVTKESNGVVSIHYRGTDPDTRYLPREPSVWHQIRESFRMGR
jgi:hypothetical protein